MLLQKRCELPSDHEFTRLELGNLSPTLRYDRLAMTNLKNSRESRFAQEYDEGIATFCRLFIHWMDSNRWTHPVLIELVRAALDGASWLHSSQITALRQGKLRNPGPRGFIAIAELNKAMFEYKTSKRLVPGTTTDLNYLQGYAITENGAPPEVGWWFEVFCGQRIPKDVDLDIQFRTDIEAADFSRGYARLVRQLMAYRGFDLFENLDKVVKTYYPAGDQDRVQKVSSVLLNQAVWTPEELRIELPALVAVSTELGGPASQEQLIDEIS